MNFAETTTPSRVDQIVRAAIESQRLPGVALAIGSAGRIVYSKGYGYRNLSFLAEPDCDTVYSIASISKQFAAALTMREVERGTLELSNTIDRWFPFLSNSRFVTIEHLLANVSGVPGYTEAPVFDQLKFCPASPEEIIATVAQRAPAFVPGAEFQYSNTNYVMLGRILELIKDETFEDIITRDVIDPLGMSNSGVDGAAHVRENGASPYIAYALGEYLHARQWDPSWKLGAGGLFSTCRDLIAWNTALRLGNVIHRQSYNRMATSGRLDDGSNTGYGFGLFVSENLGVREVRHGGGLPGFTLENVTYPELDLDIVVLTNQSGHNLNFSIVRPLLAAITQRPELSALTSPLLAVHLPGPPPDALTYISTARNGRIEDLRPVPELRRFLTRDKREDLLALGRLGELRDAQLVQSSRRDPNSYFYYRLECDAGRFICLLGIRDGGELVDLDVVEWDNRPT